MIATGMAGERVAADAVWHPAAGFIDRFHRQCDGQGGAAFDACFVAAMAAAGASPAALAFARRLDGQAYLQRLDHPGGPIAVAHAFYPFRANENDAWLLTGGTPALIDVDDERYLALGALRAAPCYRAILGRFPRVSLWPADRSAGTPEVRRAGRQFVVAYRLRDQCHACAIVGDVRFAFNFDRSGRFLGTRLVSVAPAGD